MTSIIVLLSVVFIINELNILFRPTRYDRKVAKIRDDFKTRYINPNHRGFLIFNLLYTLWQVVGLFTPYWPVFLCQILISIIGLKINKTTNGEINRSRHRQIDSLFHITLLVVLIYLHHTYSI